ncbi:MAG: HPr family phosphocarrier protein [Pseudomonadales bacterium]
MIEKTITIINKYGLHARAAAKFVSTTSAFSSTIMIEKDGNSVDGKSIMSVMMLGAAKGSVIQLQVDGSDEALALQAIEQIILNRFDEEE